MTNSELNRESNRLQSASVLAFKVIELITLGRSLRWFPDVHVLFFVLFQYGKRFKLKKKKQ